MQTLKDWGRPIFLLAILIVLALASVGRARDVSETWPERWLVISSGCAEAAKGTLCISEAGNILYPTEEVCEFNAILANEGRRSSAEANQMHEVWGEARCVNIGPHNTGA